MYVFIIYRQNEFHNLIYVGNILWQNTAVCASVKLNDLIGVDGTLKKGKLQKNA